MSKWPVRRVSLPQDQPTRYFAVGLVRDSIWILACYGMIIGRCGEIWWIPSSSAGRAARYDALERT